VPSVADRFLMGNGLECSFSAGLRGLEEEVFKGEGIDPNRVTHFYRIGRIIDYFNDREYENFFYAAEIAMDLDLEKIRRQLTLRELTDVQPISNLSGEQLFPFSVLTLFNLKYMLKNGWFKGAGSVDFLYDLKILEQLHRLSYKQVREAYLRYTIMIEGEGLLYPFLERQKDNPKGSMEIQRLKIYPDYGRIIMTATNHLTMAIVLENWKVLDDFDVFETDPKTGERYI